MKKTKIIAIIAVSFVVFAMTFFALAQNQTGNSLFLDSDQDGLTDQEEKMIGTDPFKADTDNDGYSDGKEVGSGYDPLKPAPGDKLVPDTQSSPVSGSAQPSAAAETSPVEADSAVSQDPTNGQTDPANASLLSQLGQNNALGVDATTDLSSDPNNPNLTNEMIGQLMQLTKDKATTDSSFADNPTFSATDLSQITQGALQTVDVTKDLPEIKDSDINILPEVKDKNLSADDIKAKQKAEIEKYLSQSAFILASNSPFAVGQPNDLQTNLNTESANLISALASGDTSKVDAYAQKAQAGIDQMKKIEVPYVLKDIHKSTLQLAIYTLNLKSSLAISASDPMKSLAAVSSLQSVAQSATKLQEEFSQILTSYGIDAIKFP
jgi:glycerophosphoryl diester phosphodiesterase